jgi:polyisoprenoid-binding protein YceI
MVYPSHPNRTSTIISRVRSDRTLIRANGNAFSSNGYKARAKIHRWLRSWLVFLVVVGAEALRAQEMTVELDPANTRIEFTVPATLHTVHGTFALKTGTVHFNLSTGSASGVVVVDATSGDSGNKGRDHKMHEEILGSQRYPEITFTPTKISGKPDLRENSSVQIEGIFRLRGTDHPLTLTVPVRMQGQSLSAKVHIVIPYVAWGLKNPSTFMLHVNEKVDIDISTAGRVLPQAAPPPNNR